MNEKQEIMWDLFSDMDGESVLRILTSWNGMQLLNDGLYQELVNDGIIEEEEEEEEEEEDNPDQEYIEFLKINLYIEDLEDVKFTTDAFKTYIDGWIVSESAEDLESLLEKLKLIMNIYDGDLHTILNRNSAKLYYIDVQNTYYYCEME